MSNRIFILFFLNTLICFSQAGNSSIIGAIAKNKNAVSSDSTIIKLGRWKATPTAQGYGMYTEGGRGGDVFFVDNNSASGTGSLLQALRFITVPRYIAINVGSDINVTVPIKITGAGTEKITVLGQTAPGNGLVIRGAGLETYESEIIIQHLKIRPGRDGYNPSGLPPNDPNYEPADAVKIASQTSTTTENVYFAHNTVSWGGDGLLDIGGPSSSIFKKISIQENLFFENPDKHYGGLVDGGVSSIDSLTYYRNILAHNDDRGWAVSSAQAKIEILNSIFYYGSRSAWVSWGSTTDWINNEFISHPGVSRGSPNTVNRVVGGKGTPETTGVQSETEVYFSGNTDDGGPIVLGSLSSSVVNSRINDSSIPLWPASQLQEKMFPSIGAYLFRDATDTRILNDVANRTGSIINHEDSVGGYDTQTFSARSGTYDTAPRDGVADTWANERNISDVRAMPNFFTSSGRTFDNREYENGTWDGNVYVGGTLTGEKILEYREIFWHEKGGEFQRLIEGL